MADLSTDYMGMRLSTPLVASASPLSRQASTVQELERAGIGAVVLFSLFEEQFDPLPEQLDPRARDCPLERGDFLTRPHEYLEHLARLSATAGIPILASVSVSRPGRWIDYVPHLAEAGAAAVEISLYPVLEDPFLSSTAIEAAAVELVEEVAWRSELPIAVKLPPYLSAPVAFCRRLVEAGAQALVLFQRPYHPDIDIERCELVTDLELSAPADVRLPVAGVLALREYVRADLAATGGIHDLEQVVAVLMAGAKVAMLCSVLLERGPEYAGELCRQLNAWLDRRGYSTVAEVRGRAELAAGGLRRYAGLRPERVYEEVGK
ncbi:MAG: dihydroorotate dehydrogenase-like protein [Candidatus Dadabacteria bacterium]|nr:MAG: dihydroorotate dehydrogenase-like protein [Candidatus Dadabacteria bacterium]